MNSRERVNRLLNRQPVDRIPNGLGGCETTGLHILAYDKLKKVLNIKDSANRMYTFMTNAVVEPSVLQAINGDIITLNSKMCPSHLWGSDSRFAWKDISFWGKQFQVPVSWNFKIEDDGAILWEDINWRCPAGGIYFDPDPTTNITDLFNVETLPSLKDYNPPMDFSDEKLRALEKAACWLSQNTEFSICCGETIEDLQIQPGGTIAWWMLMAQEPDIAHEFINKACEASLSQLVLLDQAVGKYADILSIAHDFGDSRGITIGPELWRKIYKPHYKKLFTEWHKITDMKINMHSCGAISNILEDLIECGLDIINPIQISAMGMEPERLKKSYGDRLIFYGGCFDAVQTSSQTSDELVYNTVRRNIEILSKDGGYIFSGVHNMPGDTPESHIKAVLNAYNDCCCDMYNN